MKKQIKLIAIFMALFVLAACNQPANLEAQANTEESQLLGLASVSISVDGLSTQTPDAFINAYAAKGLGIKQGISDNIFDPGNGYTYLRQRVEVTNNTGKDLKNLTFMAISADPNAVSATRNLKTISGKVITQEEAFNSQEKIKGVNFDDEKARKALGIDPAYLPRPIHARERDGLKTKVDVAHADLTFYDEAELAAVIPAIDTLLGGKDGVRYKLFEYGFQVGDVAKGETKTVDIAFAIPGSDDVNKTSKLARFNFIGAFITDPAPKVAQGPLEVTGEPDSGAVASAERFNNPPTGSNLSTPKSVVIVGGNTRDLPSYINVAAGNLTCLDDVLIGYNKANYQEPAYLASGFEKITKGEKGKCPTINDTNSFKIDPEPASTTKFQDAKAGETIEYDKNKGTFAAKFTSGGKPLKDREVTVIFTNATDATKKVTLVDADGKDLANQKLTGKTDDKGVVTFEKIAIKEADNYKVSFSSSGVTSNKLDLKVGGGKVVNFKLENDIPYDAGKGTIDLKGAFPIDWVKEAKKGATTGNLTIVAIDKFGNATPAINPASNNSKWRLSIELYKNGQAVDKGVVGMFNVTSSSPEKLTDPYPTKEFYEIQFPDKITSPAVPSKPENSGPRWAFTGTAGSLVDNGKPKVGNLEGPLLIASKTGTGYSYKITVKEAINSTTSYVLETKKFNVEATVGSIVIIKQPATSVAGEEILGDAPGQKLQVKVLDTDGNKIVGRKVGAFIAKCPLQGNKKISIDYNSSITSASAMAKDIKAMATGSKFGSGAKQYCTFSDGNVQGGGIKSNSAAYTVGGDNAFSANSSGDVVKSGTDKETGRRFVTATTNQEGIAVFTGDSALTIGVAYEKIPSAGTDELKNVSYKIAFVADYDRDTPVAETSAEFKVEAKKAAKLEFVDDDGKSLTPQLKVFDDNASTPAPVPDGKKAWGEFKKLQVLAYDGGNKINVKATDKFGQPISGFQIEASLASENQYYNLYGLNRPSGEQESGDKLTASNTTATTVKKGKLAGAATFNASLAEIAPAIFIFPKGLAGKKLNESDAVSGKELNNLTETTSITVNFKPLGINDFTNFASETLSFPDDFKKP